MVLSNKKLKQKMRAAKAQILIESLNGLPSEINPKTVESLKTLQDLAAQKSRLSKRQKQKQKAKIDDQREVDSNVEATNVSKAKSEQVNAKKAKGKRDLTSASESGNVQEPGASKRGIRKRGETGNKAGNMQINDETGKGIGASDPEELVLNSFLGDDRIEQEPSTKVYVGGIPYYSTEDDIRSYFESCGSITHVDCLSFPDSGKFRGIAIITFKTEAAAKRALAFDGSDMGGLFLKIQPFKSAKGGKESNFSPAAVQGYYRIYVGNLAWNVTEDDLRMAFSDCKITAIRLGQDKETGEFKGYAHIDFANDLYFGMALKLDQTLVCGRPIKISCAVPKQRASSKPKDNQADGNMGVNARQDQTSNRDAEIVTQQKDNHANGNKGGVHQGYLEDKDKISTVTKDQEMSMEAGNVSSSKIRRTCYECGEKGHLSTACPNYQAAHIKSVAGTDQKISMEAGNVSSSKIHRSTCYECGEQGHVSSSCPNKQAADVKSVAAIDQEISMEARSVSSSKIRRRTCYECGEKGHLSTACPNKQAADVKSLQHNSCSMVTQCEQLRRKRRYRHGQ